VMISGRLDELPSAGLAGGRAAPALDGSWPRVTSFPRPQELVAALESDAGAGTEAAAGEGDRAGAGTTALRVEPRILLLDPREPRGYVREWKPGGRGPEQNWSYAIQWWSFAVVLAGLYVGLNLRRTREGSK